MGEPGFASCSPRRKERRWVRRHGQARLSVLDRWPRWVAVTPANEWKRPAQKAEDFAALASYSRSVVFYAVVCDEIEQVLQFFKTRVEAETMLKRVLVNEPDWREVLHVERVELVTGGLNQRVTHPTSAAIYRYTPHNPTLG